MIIMINFDSIAVAYFSSISHIGTTNLLSLPHTRYVSPWLQTWLAEIESANFLRMLWKFYIKICIIFRIHVENSLILKMYFTH